MESTKKQLPQQVPEFPELQWCWFKLQEMEPVALYDMLALREAIFVVEQSCVYQELDGLDKTAQHLLMTLDQDVVACLRLLSPAEQTARVRIGRVAVLPDWRKRGIAGMMMQQAIARSRQDYPSCDIYLDAQTYLQGFYKSLGFRVCGDEFLEDGIPHVPMHMQAGINSEQ